MHFKFNCLSLIWPKHVDRWVVNWHAHEGTPKSLDENTLLKTQITPTDDSPQLHGSFQATLGLRNSKHGQMERTVPVNGMR